MRRSCRSSCGRWHTYCLLHSWSLVQKGESLCLLYYYVLVILIPRTRLISPCLQFAYSLSFFFGVSGPRENLDGLSTFECRLAVLALPVLIDAASDTPSPAPALEFAGVQSSRSRSSPVPSFNSTHTSALGTAGWMCLQISTSASPSSTSLPNE